MPSVSRPSGRSGRPKNTAPCPYCGKAVKFFNWRRINGVPKKRCKACDTVLEWGVEPDPTELYSDSRVCDGCGKTLYFDVGDEGDG